MVIYSNTIMVFFISANS